LDFCVFYLLLCLVAKNMIISFLCTSAAWGGLELITHKEAVWLQALGQEVSVCCPAGSRLAVACQTKEVQVFACMPKSKYTDFEAIKKLGKQFRQIDILVIAQSQDIPLAVLAKQFSGAKCQLVYMQNMQVGVKKKDFFHTWFYRQLAAWVSPLAWLKQDTLAKTAVKPKQIHIIPIGIETQSFAQTSHTLTQARQQLGLPQNVKMAGMVGRIDRQKGQDIFIKAIGKLQKQGIILHGVIIGEETYGGQQQYTTELKTLIAELGLTEQIHFCPFQPDAPLAFAALDYFVMASISETYGLVTLEAMASKKLVIGGAAGGTAELVQDHQTGLLYQSQDHESLAAKLKFALEEPEKVAQIVENALAYVSANYDYTTQMKKWLTLFEELVNTYHKK
jgi:D-inositol-3-phosphate glycosyltransferase